MTGQGFAPGPQIRLAGVGREFQAKLAGMLDGIDLLADFAWREIETLARYLDAYEATAGCALFREGEPGRDMLVLLEGRVVIEKENDEHEPVVVAIESRGRSFGEMALIDGEPRSATCRALAKSMVAVLTRASFDRLCVDHPVLANKLLMRIARLLSRRLRMTSGKLVEHLDAAGLDGAER